MMKSMSKPRRVSNESSLSFGSISSVIKRPAEGLRPGPPRSRDKKSVNGDDADYRRGSHGTCQTVVACVGFSPLQAMSAAAAATGIATGLPAVI